MQLKWSLFDTSKGARSIEEIKILSKKPAKQQYGCKRLPLFESIPMDRVIIDTLHLFLRIGDLLINLLIMDLRRQDGVEKGKLDKFDKSKQTHLAAYEQFLNDSCRISFREISLDLRKLDYSIRLIFPICFRHFQARIKFNSRG